MSTEGTDAELSTALAEFMYAFEQVFHYDWKYARSMLHPMNEMIAADGTFLEPHVKDESDDWGHRGMLLERYRKLRELMKARGIEPIEGVGQI